MSGDRAWLSVTDIDANWETREPLVELDPVTDDREGVIADIEECRWMGLTAATVTGLDDVGRWTSAFPDEGWIDDANDITECSLSLPGVNGAGLVAIEPVGEDGGLLPAGVVGFWLSNDLMRLCTPGEGSPRLFLYD